MGPGAPCGAWIEHPGQAVTAIIDHTMAMTIDDRARLREAPAQQSVAISRRHLMAVDQHQRASGQRLFQPFGQMDEQPTILLRPIARDVIVAEHGQDVPEPWLELG